MDDIIGCGLRRACRAPHEHYNKEEPDHDVEVAELDECANELELRIATLWYALASSGTRVR